MTRQKIRRTVIFISFLFFPITIYFLSPVLVLMGAYEGIIAGSLVIFILMFFTSMLVGRLFCSWLCPGGGLQEACFYISGKPARGGKANLIKYFIWVPWLILMVIMLFRSGSIPQVDMLFHIPGGISVSQPGDYFVYYFFVGLILVLSLAAGKRAFCHYVCWMAPFMIIGTKIKSLRFWPSLHLSANPDSCNDCKRCNKVCPMSLDVNYLVKSGIEDDSECILCGSCIDNCPQSSIKYKFLYQNGN
ncbi:MAG: 4Fe-4S binding protein [Bacillota bacterium]|nr:4Fe-4S binding protein [Bacillota bacterium]